MPTSTAAPSKKPGRERGGVRPPFPNRELLGGYSLFPRLRVKAAAEPVRRRDQRGAERDRRDHLASAARARPGMGGVTAEPVCDDRREWLRLHELPPPCPE